MKEDIKIKELKNILLLSKIQIEGSEFGEDRYSYYIRYTTKDKKTNILFKYRFLNFNAIKSKITVQVHISNNVDSLNKIYLEFHIESKFIELYCFHKKLFTDPILLNSSFKTTNINELNLLKLKHNVKSF
jgi:hypothetical protein